MPVPLHMQTVIACIWDFDRTLIPGYSQEVLFDEYEVDGSTFWQEVNSLPEAYESQGIKVAADTAYLGHMLTYVSEGKFPELSNGKLRELGAKIVMSPGMPGFLSRSRSILEDDSRYNRHSITLEHYVVSTGVRPLIEGSAIGEHVDGIWANDFIETPLGSGYQGQLPHLPNGQITQVGYMLDNTSKTRAIFEINKGVNKLDGVDVNTLISPEDRRVPISHMIYVADGPSDIPVFSIMNQFGGHNLAVFSSNGKSNFETVKRLQDQGRVQMIGEADFSEGTLTSLWLETTLCEIADRIATNRERYIADMPGAPGHVT